MGTAKTPTNPYSSLVNSILRQDARARDNDSVLLVHLLQQRGMRLSKEQIHVLLGVDVAEVIRARYAIQKDGNYLPLPDIAKVRGTRSTTAKERADEALARQVEAAMELPLGSTTPHAPLSDFSKK